MPHRERAPQEVTPVRIEAAGGHAPREGDPLDGGTARERAYAAPPAGPAPEPAPTDEEIEHDVLAVRRRALASAAYGAGAVAAASTVGFAGVHASPSYALSAFTITLFCGLAAVAGTVWTWAGARRLGDVGISVFDAIDGAWRDVVARRAVGVTRRGALGTAGARGAGRRTPATSRPVEGAAGVGALGPGVHRVPASPAVLQGRWGAAVTRAVEDRAALAHMVAQLGPADRDMIPDVLPTADVLVGRVGELATTLHELDRDAPASLVTDVEARLAAARAAAAATGGPPDTDRARRIELLERQHATLADLALRREQLAARLDSAGLLLQNMRLDLLRLRSAGIESALGELTSATREATALSRDIVRALDVAEELRKQ